MELLRTTIKILTVGSLGLAAIQIYLVVNKLWKRKHERAVAESISIMGEFIGIVPLVILTANFLLERQWAGAVDSAMWVLAGGVTITIGTGMWVEGKRGKGLWTLVKESLALERKEVGDLARSLFRPSAARKVLDILGKVAMIDAHLDEREREFIMSFAEAWGIEFKPDELQRSGASGHVDYTNLRQDVADYLATSPPKAQAAQLGDVLNSLVRIDEQITDEEELVLGELDAMLSAYVEDEYDAPMHGIAVVPQDEKQDRAIGSLLPDVPKRKVEGGLAYVTGPYHSERYAEVICDGYRSLNFFATVVRYNSDKA